MRLCELGSGTLVSRTVRFLWSVPVMGALVVGLSQSAPAQFYLPTNLVSDLPGMALVTDTNLVGAWGVVHSDSSPWWVNTTFSGLSLVINGAGQPLSLVVAIPPTNGATATGITFNGGTNFDVAPNTPARFIFATLNGTISGWNPTQANTKVAMQVVNNAGTAAYSGIVLAENGGKEFLYVANFAQNKVDVFDSTFSPVMLAAGAFTDHKVPKDLTVFNVQLVGDWLYVTHAPTNVFGGGKGPGKGFVDVFNLNGHLLRRLQHGFWMNSPWGVTMAPADFGHLSNRVLVGMFGSGAIAAFDKRHGRFVDFVRNTDALPLIIGPMGLWGLGFGNGAMAGPTNTLYFATDFTFGGHFHGLFGTLTPAPSSQIPGMGESEEDHGGDDDSQGDNNHQGENNQGDNNHQGDSQGDHGHHRD